MTDARAGAGVLFLIGGHEDREGDRTILRAFAASCSEGPVLLLTAASGSPERYLPLYQDAFAPLGVVVHELRLGDRIAADDPTTVAAITFCSGIFISGGDQLRGAATLRDSLAAELIRSRWLDGRPVAGTSAGASLLGEAMLGRGANDDTPNVAKLEVVDGLGLLRGALVDQHLSERGRTPRLLAATALSGKLGIGIDEDTAAVVRGDELTVIGSGTVTIADGVRVKVLTADDEPMRLALG